MLSFGFGVRRNRTEVVRVPQGWLPRVDLARRYSFWAPSAWQPDTSLSRGSCFALVSESVLMEVFSLIMRKDLPDPTGTDSDSMRRSIVNEHPDARVLLDEAYTPQPFDRVDALNHLAAMRLLDTYGFVGEMQFPWGAHLCSIEYREKAGFKTTTDSYSFYCNRQILHLNMKTLSSCYRELGPIFDQVAATALIGSYSD